MYPYAIRTQQSERSVIRQQNNKQNLASTSMTSKCKQTLNVVEQLLVFDVMFLELLGSSHLDSKIKMEAHTTGVTLSRESHSEVRSSHLFYASNFQTHSQPVIVSPSAAGRMTHNENNVTDQAQRNPNSTPLNLNIPQQAIWTVHHGQSPSTARRDPAPPSEAPPPYSEVDKIPTALPATNPPAYRQYENSIMSHAHTTSMGSETQKPFKLKKEYLRSNLAVVKVLEFVSLLWWIEQKLHKMTQLSNLREIGSVWTDFMLFEMINQEF